MNSGCGHKMKVIGVGKAAFEGADGKPMILEDVLVVPEIKGNLVSLRKMGMSGVCTATNGAETFKGNLGDRVLWDLHEDKDLHNELWHVPVVPWREMVREKENGSCGCKGECVARAAAEVKELKATVANLVKELRKVNARLAAAENGKAAVADEKNGAETKGSNCKVAAVHKEKGVHKDDTRKQQKLHVMVQPRVGAATEKKMVPNSASVVADGLKANGEPKVKLSSGEAGIVGKHKSAFPKTGVGIGNKVELVEGEQFDIDALVPMPTVKEVKAIVGPTDGGCGFE
ncbi:unnamed protein product [Closterium sp. Yama58-4]|nr:unnamed protein product [Closterium sp. Yama58-4]